MYSQDSVTSAHPIVTQAKWIWPDSPNWDIHNCYALFRKTFDLKTVPAEAPLLITADQAYQLYINGRYVCRGPARGFQENWPYDEVDVSEYLNTGLNLIAVRAYNPGYSNFQYIHQGYAGFLLAANWGEFHLVTDKSWKCRRQNGIHRDLVTTSLQLFTQESVDLRKETPDWMQPQFDDSGWNAIPTEVKWNAAPWFNLQQRGIPMLEEKIIWPGTVIGQSQGSNSSEYLTTRNLTANHFDEGLAHSPTHADADEIVFEPCGSGQWRSVLIDLKKTYVGSILLEIEGATGGEVVETHHFETIDPATLCPDFDPVAHSRMAFSNRLACRLGRQSYAFYHTFGFRHMILMVRDSENTIRIRPKLRTTLYPHHVTGQFESSENTLKEIWDTCAWTERVCSMDAYVDTPYREQAQWWGDARVQAWNTFHLSGDASLLKRGIDQIATQTTPDGVTYGHAPTMAHKCILPDFTLIWILTLWDYYWQTGSLEPFLHHQNTIDKALIYFEKATDPITKLLRYDDRYWLFLDWTHLHKQGCSSVYNLWYLHALDRLAEMYSLAQKAGQAEQCLEKAQKLRDQLRKLINSDGLMQGGYSESGTVVSETSVHTQTLAILTQLCPEHEQTMLKQVLVPYITGTLETKIQPSAYWVNYVFTVLSERGYGAEVVANIRKRWAPMVDYGTTWENFQPHKARESFSHAWSAHPLFHLMQILGGIRQTAPAWNRVTIEPNFIGDSAKVYIPSPRGLIQSTWLRQDNEIRGSLTLPTGVQAKLRLPDQAERVLTDTYNYCIPGGPITLEKAN